MLSHAVFKIEAIEESQQYVDGLLNEGITENSKKNYAEAQDLLKLAYDFSKEYEKKIELLLTEVEDESDKQKLKQLKFRFAQTHMDAAYFFGANCLAQKSYKKAERLFFEALLYASLTVKDEGIKAAATLYRGICLRRLYEDDVLTNDAQTILNVQLLLTDAIKQFEALLKEGRETYRHQLGLAYLHLISFSQGGTVKGYREYLDSALAIFKKLNNKEELALARHQSGLMYCRLQDDEAALKEFEKAHSGFKALGLDKELVFTLQQIEFCQMRLGKISAQTALENSRKQFNLQIKCNILDSHEKALFIANKVSSEVSLIMAKELSKDYALKSFEQTLKKLPGDAVEELTYYLADAMATSNSQRYNAICEGFLEIAKTMAEQRSLKTISAPTAMQRLTTAAEVLTALSNKTGITGSSAPTLSAPKEAAQKPETEMTLVEAMVAIKREADSSFSPYAPYSAFSFKGKKPASKEVKEKSKVNECDDTNELYQLKQFSQ